MKQTTNYFLLIGLLVLFSVSSTCGQTFVNTNAGIIDFNTCNVKFGDINNDSHLDIVISGAKMPGRYSGVYLNDGSGNFSENTILSNCIQDLEYGDIDLGDFDNDGDLDILISGGYFDGGWVHITKVYQNDYPVLSFTAIPGLDPAGLRRGSSQWVDFDSDGDLDISLGGETVTEDGSTNEVFELYRNEGGGQFVQQRSDIIPFSQGDFSWGDFDNDGYVDLLLSGNDFSGNVTSRIYRNDLKYSGTFTELLQFQADGVFSSSNTWGDYDSDGDLDVLLAGYTGSTNICKIWRNDYIDTGAFTEMNDIALEGLQSASLHWGDIDNNGALDIISTGANPSGINTYVYNNDGTNTFSENLSILLPGVLGELELADYDNDGDLDIFLGGQTESEYWFSEIYRNDSPIANTAPSPPINLRSSIVGGVVTLEWDEGSDSETAADGLSYNLLVTRTLGESDILSPMADPVTGKRKIASLGNSFSGKVHLLEGLEPGTYYWQVQSIDAAYAGSVFSEQGSFTVLEDFSEASAIIENLSLASFSIGDFNNDQRLDIAVSGQVGGGSANLSTVYKNESIDSFTELPASILENLRHTSTEWGDVDNDGDLDLLLTGAEGVSPAYTLRTLLYINNGDETFEKKENIGIPGVYYGCALFGDYDNDGDQDIFIAGASSLYPIYNAVSKFYKNDGSGNFSEDLSCHVPGMYYCDAAWGDFDMDDDIDLLVAGYYPHSGGNYLTGILINDNGFNEERMISIDEMADGSVLWSDYDQDGDLDVIISGSGYSYRYTKVYRNDGNESFIDIKALLRGVAEGDLDMGDIDCDNDPDLLLSGTGGISVNELYKSNSGEFIAGYSFPGGYNGRTISGYADFDNDNDLDVIQIDGDYSRIFQNNGNWVNNPPSAPTNLSTERAGYGIDLSWDASEDDITPKQSLSYNLRIGTTPGAIDILSPLSDPVTGHRLVPGMGNCFLNTHWRLDTIPDGEYYWSVQAIDNTTKASTWSEEKSFQISVLHADFELESTCYNKEILFSDLSLGGAVGISDWSWSFGDTHYSTLQNPTHKYDSPGEYQVRLIVGGGAHHDTLTKQIIIKDAPAAFLYAASVCRGDMTPLINDTDTRGLNIVGWEWNFGDGQFSTEENPQEYGYTNAGDYRITLSVEAETGCVDTVSQIVGVADYPDAVVSVTGPLTFCSGDSIVFSTAYDDDYSYVWKLNGTNLVDSDSSMYIAKVSGNYSVDVTTNIGGCANESSSSDVVVNELPGAPAILASGPLVFCEGDSVILWVQDNPAYDYLWKKNGGNVGLNNNVLVVKNSGDYTVDIINSNDCISSSANTATVQVEEAPLVNNFSLSGATAFCAGETLLMGVPYDTAYEYQWYKDGIAVLDANTNQYEANEEATYKLGMINSMGCSGYSDDIVASVLPIPPSQPIIVDNTENKKAASNFDNLCLGDSISLKVVEKPNLTYLWRLDGVPVGHEGSEIIVQASGLYTAEIINEHGCKCETSNSISMNMNPSPKVPILSYSGEFSICEGDAYSLAVTNTEEGVDYSWWIEGQSMINDTSILIENPGIYMVQADNEFGCTSFSDQTTVNIVERVMPPEVFYKKGSGLICPSEEIVLAIRDLDDILTYRWKKDGVLMGLESRYEIEIEDEGYYSVEVSSFGCSAESDQVEIRYKPALPKPEIMATGESIWYLACSNDSAVYYKWYYDGFMISENTDAIYVANQDLGLYRVEISDNQECFTSSDVISIPENVIIGISQIDPWQNLKIYPNPTPGLFSLEMDNHLMGELIIDIFGETGSKIINIKFHKETAHFKTQIDLSEQPPAAYLIGLMLDKYRTNRTLIVE